MKLKLLLWKTLIAGMVALVGFTDFPVPHVAQVNQEVLAAKEVVSSHVMPSKLLTANISPLPTPTPRPIIVVQKSNPKPKVLSYKIQPVVGDCVMQWPVAAKTRTSQGFKGGHRALDISYTSGGAKSLPIVAALGGKVIQAAKGGWNGGYGNVVVIDHGNGYQTRYAHNSKVLVGVGQEVKAGQEIAIMGNTGKVHGRTGIHLHFEVLKNGQRINPNVCFK